MAARLLRPLWINTVTIVCDADGALQRPRFSNAELGQLLQPLEQLTQFMECSTQIAQFLAVPPAAVRHGSPARNLAREMISHQQGFMHQQQQMQMHRRQAIEGEGLKVTNGTEELVGVIVIVIYV